MVPATAPERRAVVKGEMEEEDMIGNDDTVKCAFKKAAAYICPIVENACLVVYDVVPEPRLRLLRLLTPILQSIQIF